MTDNRPYSKREQDKKWQEVANALSRIEIQTTTTNGRVTRLERLFTILITASAVLGASRVPELISIVRLVAGAS